MTFERDYIDRTIETVRQHKDSDNCWPQWANIFADEIDHLRAEVAAERALADRLAGPLRGMAGGPNADAPYPSGCSFCAAPAVEEASEALRLHDEGRRDADA